MSSLLKGGKACWHNAWQEAFWRPPFCPKHTVKFYGFRAWSDKVDWMLRQYIQRRSLSSISPHWISRSVLKLILWALCFPIAKSLLHGGLPWSAEPSRIFIFFSQHVFGLIPSLSKNQDLGRVKDCKIICGNMGWNDSQRDASTAFMFFFLIMCCSAFIEFIRPKSSYWVLRRKCCFLLNCNGKWSCCTA